MIDPDIVAIMATILYFLVLYKKNKESTEKKSAKADVVILGSELNKWNVVRPEKTTTKKINMLQVTENFEFS